MSKTQKKGGQTLGEALQSAFTMVSILLSFVIAMIVYLYVMGNPVNFEGGNPDGHPLPGNYLAMIYKGGYIVPCWLSFSHLKEASPLQRRPVKGVSMFSSSSFRTSSLMIKLKMPLPLAISKEVHLPM
jgi:hypothetical protein